MVDIVHSEMTRNNGGIHTPFSWIVADATARNGLSSFVATDVNKLAWQQDDDSIWVLKQVSPVVWAQVGGTAGGGGGGTPTYRHQKILETARMDVKATVWRGEFAVSTSYAVGDVFWIDSQEEFNPAIILYLVLEAFTSDASYPTPTQFANGGHRVGRHVVSNQIMMLDLVFARNLSYGLPSLPNNSVTGVDHWIVPSLGLVRATITEVTEGGTPSTDTAPYSVFYLTQITPGIYWDETLADSVVMIIDDFYAYAGKPIAARSNNSIDDLDPATTCGISMGRMDENPWDGGFNYRGLVIKNGTTITEPALARMFQGDTFPANGSPIYWRESFADPAPDDNPLSATYVWTTNVTTRRVGTYVGSNQVLIDTQAV